MMVLDGADDTVKLVDLPAGVDRILSGPQNSPVVRLQGAGDPVLLSDYDPETGAVTASDDPRPLPTPLEVNGLTNVVAQGTGLGDGFRFRFLGAAAFLFGPSGRVIAETPFPEGWLPMIPPRVYSIKTASRLGWLWSRLELCVRNPALTYRAL